VHQRLLAWAQNVPEHWCPLRLTSGHDFDPSLISYQDVCEIYPSCQIASIWNLWRCYRLLLAQMFLVLLRKYPRLEGYPDFSDVANPLFWQWDLQEAVDTICYTIPFYLGNRSRPSSIGDFSDPTITLLSHHSVSLGNPRRLGLEHGPFMPRDEHKRHAIAQGPWQIMGPLSRVLNLFSGEHGWVITEAIRPGQHDWIRDQLLRVTVLLRLPVNEGHDYKRMSEENLSVEIPKADYIARRLHEGLNIIGGH